MIYIYIFDNCRHPSGGVFVPVVLEAFPRAGAGFSVRGCLPRDIGQLDGCASNRLASLLNKTFSAIFAVLHVPGSNAQNAARGRGVPAGAKSVMTSRCKKKKKKNLSLYFIYMDIEMPWSGLGFSPQSIQHQVEKRSSVGGIFARGMTVQKLEWEDN